MARAKKNKNAPMAPPEPAGAEDKNHTPKSAVTLEHVVRIKQAYDDLKPNFVPGADRVIRHVQSRDPQFPLRRDAANGVTKKLKNGLGPATIASSRGKVRGNKKQARAPSLIASFKAALAAVPSSLTNSQGILAKKHKVSKSTIRRVVKNDLKMKVFREVKTCVS